MFRGKYLAGLKELYDAGKLEFHGELKPLARPATFAVICKQASRPEWVVYAKRPFAGPKQVLAYLSRYTHRVAISNRRLLSTAADTVTFDYKDYADAARHKSMTLDTREFVRRFCLHVLPSRFVKIRHYGLVGNRQRQQRLAKVRTLLSAAEPTTAQPTAAPKTPSPELHTLRCPFCHEPALVFIREVEPERAARLVAILNSS